MKTARLAWQEWEQEHYLLLVHFKRKTIEWSFEGLKFFRRTLFFTLFLGWLTAKITARVLHLLFFTTPPEKLVRDEQWMFGHVK